MKNRFNNLTSKEWLPFQKSWFLFEDDLRLYTENIRFFMKFDEPDQSPNLFFYGSDEQLALIAELCHDYGINLFTHHTLDAADSIQFALFDLRDILKKEDSIESYQSLKKEILPLCSKIKDKLYNRRFLSVLANNLYTDDSFYPIAWDVAKTLSLNYSLKDEKIACISSNKEVLNNPTYFSTEKNLFYSLYFRYDEKSPSNKEDRNFKLFENIKQEKALVNFPSSFKSWFVLKPPPRKKNEILHPAKYPESLAQMFIETFTEPGQNVLDPMAGTGSTQLAALMSGRHAFGIELSNLFSGVAIERCKISMNEYYLDTELKILNKDARKIRKDNFPEIDYVLTSPPYWDILNMKGAENQAKRIKKGLQTNYSDDTDDLGNISNYQEFLDELVKIYFKLDKMLKPGAYLTIVVKNIKKKGKNYPLAWDLAEKLQKKYILLPETFWLQNDASIAPYGYGNTFVSNTFHQYCLTFQKPIKK